MVPDDDDVHDDIQMMMMMMMGKSPEDLGLRWDHCLDFSPW